MRYRKKERKTKKKMRGRGSICGVNERKGGVRGWWEKKKKRERNRGREGKKIEKIRYFRSCEKKYIY